MNQRISELERLHQLRESGALTQAEYEQEKARLLSGVADASHPKRRKSNWMLLAAAAVVVWGAVLWVQFGGSTGIAAGVANASETDAKEAVRATLFDPESAVFGEFTQVDENLACLTVNGKNRFGGMAGKQEAFLIKNPRSGRWNALAPQEGTHAECIGLQREMMASLKRKGRTIESLLDYSEPLR